MTIEIWFGLGGDGKTYCITDRVVNLLLDKKNTRKVFTNYPVSINRPLNIIQKLNNLYFNTYNNISRFLLFHYHKDLSKFNPKDLIVPEKLSSLVWKDEESYLQSVHDAYLFLDESHEKYSAVYAYELNKDDRRFISKHRHNTIDLILSSQHYDDIHPFIRRRCNFFVHITKRHWFWKKNPSYFIKSTYKTTKDFMNKDADKKHKLATRYKKEKVKFTDLVAGAFNTHFYRDLRPEPTFIRWDEELANRDSKMLSPLPIVIEKKIKKREKFTFEKEVETDENE